MKFVLLFLILIMTSFISPHLAAAAAIGFVLLTCR